MKILRVPKYQVSLSLVSLLTKQKMIALNQESISDLAIFEKLVLHVCPCNLSLQFVLQEICPPSLVLQGHDYPSVEDDYPSIEDEMLSDQLIETKGIIEQIS